MAGTTRPEEIRAELWRRGELGWKLRPAQIPAYRYLRQKRGRHVVVAMHRGSGKSYLGGVILSEMALKGRNLVYYGPTSKMVRAIAFPQFKKIFSDCPPDLQPKFRYLDGCFEFPTGGIILVSGSERGQIDSTRGIDIHGALLDEAGFMADPDYLVRDVVMPRALPVDGVVMHISTPPKTPSHPFARRMKEAEAGGYLFRLGVDDNPEVTPELRAEYVRESGGGETTTFLREYLCQVCTEEQDAVIPELCRGRKPDIVEVPRPKDYAYRLKYVALRVDYSRLSVALFAWHDAETGRVVVEDEVTAERANGADLIELFVKKEKELWGEGAEIVRSVFCSEEIRTDLARDGYFVRRIDDKDFPANVERLRTKISRGSFLIHPRCRTLSRHIADAIWNDTRTGLASSGDGGRFDALSAAACLVRDLRPRDVDSLAASRDGSVFVPNRYDPDSPWSRAAGLGILGKNGLRKIGT